MAAVADRLSEARAGGLEVREVDGELLVRGPRRLAAVAEALLGRKTEVLELLRLEAASDCLGNHEHARLLDEVAAGDSLAVTMVGLLMAAKREGAARR